MPTTFPEDFPRLIVFEGVDGVGKTTLVSRLDQYLRSTFPSEFVAAGSFPGSRPGTFGEWVYRVHHGQVVGLNPDLIAPQALQLLHVAAHVDAIHSWIAPSLERGVVILDRYWWSTYAYSRLNIGQEESLALVAPEQPLWNSLPSAVVIYVSRAKSLKDDEIDGKTYAQIDAYYRELIANAQGSKATIHQLVNDDTLESCWQNLLTLLKL